MRLKHFYFHSLLYVFIALFLMVLPINSYAENPFLILKEKLQETLLNTLNSTVNETVDTEFDNDLNVDLKSTVPALIGKTSTEAEQLLKKQHLVLGKVIDKESSQAIGTIISQSHGVDSEVAHNTAINIEVAIAVKSTQQKPPSEPQKTIKPAPSPKVSVTLKLSRNKVTVGDSLMLQAVVHPSPAESKNLQYNFTVDGKRIPSKIAKVIHKTTQAGRVIVTASIREENGKWLHSKSQWLAISKAKSETVKPPADKQAEDKQTNETNTDKDKAAKQQEQAKIAEEQAQEAQSVKIAEEQAAAQAAEIAQAIEVETTTKVPNVVGLPLDEAERLLNAVNLQIGSISDKASIGLSLILDQIPKAGNSVALDSRVDLVRAIKPDFKFKLSVDRNQIKQNEKLTFNGTLTPADIDAPIHYRFIINNKTHRSDQPIWTHRFFQEGKYRIMAEAIVEGDGIYRSSPIEIQVAPIWQAPIAKIKPPTLIVAQGDIATFSSRSSHDKKTTLSLHWMDESGGSGENTAYTVDTQHWQAGEYWVSLRVKDDQGLEASDKAQLIVMASSDQVPSQPLASSNTRLSNIEPQLSLSVPRYHTTSGKALPFTLKLPQSITATNIRYRIHFGDGEVLETSRLWAQHRYAKLGRYNAFVETTYQQQIIRSSDIKIWVWPSWFLLAITGIGLLMLAGLMKLFLFRTQTKVKTKDSHIDYIAVPDMGEQRLEIKSRASQHKTRVTFNSPYEKD